jgi:NADP-dependent 3-hydroxy acid dehydrogenase YdfG
MVDKRRPQKVFILGASSDIGKALVMRYLDAGFQVAGTYRNFAAVDDLKTQHNLRLYHCDLNDAASIADTVRAFIKQVGEWDIFISSVGTEEPIGRFFDCDFGEWEASVLINSTTQLRVLHQLYPFRCKGETCNAVFFAGGGTNTPFPNYSAYCVSKILLIKMCEVLDAENKDLNVFILGPGFVRTKIHQQTLDHPREAGQNYERTVQFLRPDNPGTSFDDIYECITWAIQGGREIAGGRNFSVVHDPWRRGGIRLIDQLREDSDKFKLRRFRNQD